MLKTIQHMGLKCVQLANETLSMLITQSVGPRIITLQLNAGENLFAQLPDTVIETPGMESFHLWGGHRLWHAPEINTRTYLPDNLPVKIKQISDGLQVEQALETATGLQKTLKITLPDNSATVIVEHNVTNHGLWPVTCALWAITQMRPGGTAVLPQRTALSDKAGLQPNRPLILWPYTDINNPHVTWGNKAILFTANMTDGAFKVGFPNPHGWLAYHLNDTLFVKQADYDTTAVYLDYGASTQVYCNSDFLELETLSPETTIEPGATAVHRETWQLFPNIKKPTNEAAAVALAAKIGLSI
ncbi:MAG: hypothetical protein KDE48_18120 [Anaerolineales bacterium]|nr:hypothetical protein [Anaerolineales bacterium]